MKLRRQDALRSCQLAQMTVQADDGGKVAVACAGEAFEIVPTDTPCEEELPWKQARSGS